jgi:acyl-CoA synthetase (AMP-forming)/AMP-acid ligase II
LSVQRVIEQQAVSRASAPALTGGSGAISYRDLNLRANGVARGLAAAGLRRGSTVVVKMEKSVDTAIVLLAVLKAGAAYMWVDPAGATAWPYGVSFPVREGGVEEQWKSLDVRALVAVAQAAPGLPIVTRPTDIACVLAEADGTPGVLVPHQTITALLQQRPAIELAQWNGDAGALGLLVGLMSGATVSVAGEPVTAAA